MKKYINDHGKQCWSEVELDSEFSPDNFHLVESKPDFYNDCDRDIQFAFHTNLGSITVLNRMTGFGYRDIETGFRDTDGNFWLASGNYDVRKSGCKTVGEAIEWVKINANTCVGTLSRLKSVDKEVIASSENDKE